MKKITFWLFVFLFCAQVNAQIWTIASCSNLGTTTYGPMNSGTLASSTNRTAVIYPASQLTMLTGQVLNGMYFQRTGIAPMTGTPNFKIYLKQVTASDWGTSALDWATGITGATLVYDSNPTTAVGITAGWKPFPFSTNFTYGGIQNLAVFMEYSNPTTLTTSIQWNYEYTAPCSIITNSTTTKYGNTNVTGLLATSLASQDFRRPLIGFDFVVTCPAPTSFLTSNITTNSVNLNWVAGGTETAWEYVVIPATDPTPLIGTPVTTNSALVNGLSPNTTYKVLVRAVCSSSDKSFWREAANMRTLCVPFVEYIEDFETTSTGTAFLPGCWSKGASTGNVSNTTGSVAPMSPANRLIMSISTTTNAFAILPGVSNLQANTHRLKFKTYATVASKTIDVGYLTNPADFATFVVIQSLPITAITAITAEEFSVVPTGIPAGISSLVLRLPTGTATTVYLDDFKWEANTTCVEPTATIATNVLTNSAQIDWTEPTVPAANGYEYFLSTSNVTPLSTATPTGNVAANSNSINIGSLTPNTSYSIWIRSRCSTTSRSAWSTRYTFLTNCTDVTAFSQNFDAALAMPSCWKKLGPGGTGTIVANTGTTSLPNCLSLNSTGTTIALQGLVIMPPVSNAGAGTHRLVFRARSTGTVGGVIQVGYVSDNFDNNTFTAVQSFTPTSNTVFDSFSAILGTAPGTNKFLAFRQSGTNINAVLIDNVSWEPIPSCIEPSLLNSSLVTNNTATISWTEALVPAVLGYQYFVSTTNTAPNTASVATGSVGVGISTAILSGLSQTTTYFVWVRAVCSASDSSAWTSSTSFTTSCNPITSFPWNENFTTFPPQCFSRFGAGTTATGPTGTALGFWEADSFLNGTQAADAVKINLYFTNRIGWLVTPTISFPAGNYTFSFDYALTGWNNSNSILMGSDDSVKVLISSDNGTSWSDIAVFNSASSVSNSRQEFTYNIPVASATSSVKFAILGTDGTVDDAPDYDFFIDNFKIQVTPTCFKPTALVLGTVGSTTASVSWTAPTVNIPSNGYEYFISTLNVAPNAASVSTGSTAASVITANLTGLVANTNYFMWVRSVCSTTDKSEWSQSIGFSTLCTPLTTFTQNFDVALSIPTCWRRVGTLGTVSFQTAGSFSASNCLNISSSTITNQAIVAMPNVSNIAAGTHRLRFKARASVVVGGVIEVGYLTNIDNGSSFVSIQSFTTTSTTIYNSFSAILGTVAPSTAVLAMRHSGDPANAVLIDDVSWEAIPTCFEPSNTTFSNLSNSSATISWTAPTSNPANGYEYFIATLNVVPNAASTATGATAASIVTANLTGLAPATNHFVWVRSVCSASDKSEWIPSISFITLCAPVATFTQNFDAAITFPACWAKVGPTGAVGVQTTGNASTPNCMTINSSAATNRAVVSMPLVSNTSAGTHWLKFKARSSTTVGGVIEVGYLTDASNANSFMSVQSFVTNSTTVYNNFFSFLGTAPTANSVLAFRHTGTPANAVLVDDVSWEALPACAEPSTVTVSNLGVSAATVSWTASASLPANGYQYFVSTTNTPPTAASVATGSTGAGVTTVILTGLVPNTQYFVWVRSVCSATVSSAWTANVFSFTTPCAPIATLPWEEGFEGIITPSVTAFPSCWTKQNGDWSTAIASTYNTPRTGTKYIRSHFFATNEFMWTPSFQLTANTNYTFSFYAQGDGFLNWNLDIFHNTIQSSLGATQLGGTYSPTGPGSAAIQTYNLVTRSFTPSTTGVYTFGLRVNQPSSSPWYFAFDDFKVDVVLSNNSFDNSNFTYYPNPVKDILNLNYSQSITNVAVFNLLGQKVITNTVNANQSKIDMSNLTAGTYLVKVTADNQVKTIKVIKE